MYTLSFLFVRSARVSRWFNAFFDFCVNCTVCVLTSRSLLFFFLPRLSFRWFIFNSIFSDGFLICAHVIPHSSHPFYLKNKIEYAVRSCFVRLKITSINPFISDSSRTRPSQNSNNMQLSILLGIPNQYISRTPPCFCQNNRECVGTANGPKWKKIK